MSNMLANMYAHQKRRELMRILGITVGMLQQEALNGISQLSALKVFFFTVSVMYVTKMNMNVYNTFINNTFGQGM